MKNKPFILFAVVLTFFTSACATPIQHATPSGKVEATINGVKKAAVKDRLVNDMINRGYTVTKSDSNMISFDRPVDNVMAAMFFGSRYDSTPNARVSFNLVQNPKSVRVIADCNIITNPGSAFEQKTDANESAGTADVQKWLNQTKTALERK